MKKLALSALFVMLFFGTALAHNGAISLYTSETISTCSMPITPLGTDTIRVYYVKDQGVILGFAVQFRMLASNDFAIFTGATWTPQVQVILGDLDNGIALAANQCLGSSANVAYIGRVYVFWSDFSTPVPKFSVSIVAHPEAQPPGIYITQCNAQQTKWAVLGGTFVFNGSCNPGIEPKSWGAIKDLFR
jgi:hypothetical protein